MNTQVLKLRLKYIFLLFIFVSCSNEPPEILKIEGSEKISFIEKFAGWDDKVNAYRNERGGLTKEECFIVVNHPKNKSELIKFINEFNAETINKDTILKYNRGYRRVFYKKTHDTMEAYTKDINSTSRNIDFYYLDKWCRNDELIRITWSVDIKKQTFNLTYYIYDDYKYITNISEDELFNIK